MNERDVTPCLFFTGPRRAEVRDVAIGEPGPGEVLVRAVATGVSAGTELNVYRGTAPQWRRRQDPRTRRFVATNEPDWRYPLAYGYSCVGEIAAVGAGVEASRLGELVFAYAPHRGYSVVRAERTIALPAAVAPEVAVMLANLNTAYNGVLDARPMLGGALVVFGLGIVGQLVVRLAARTGQHRLVVVDGIGQRRELALAGGATHALDPGRDRVAEAVRELTEGRGADLVIEVSGAPAALNEAIRTAGCDGTVVAMSWYGGSFESLDLMGEFHHNRVRIRSSQVGAVDPALGPLWTTQRRMARAVEGLASLDLRPLVTHCASIVRAPEMLALLDTRPADAMQVVLTYDAPIGA